MPTHLGCCDIEGRTIVLDLRRDRYIELDPGTRAVLNRYRDTPADLDDDAPELGRLQHLGLIVWSKAPPAPALENTRVPTRSLRDEPARAPQAAWPIVPEVFALLRRSRRMLKRRGLEAAVSEVRLRNDASPLGNSSGELAAAAERFRAARQLIPVQPNCLLDSLTLSSFLSRRGLGVALVFGVKLDPFAAHCWLQAPDAIVNDSADAVMPFTPVLAV